MSPRFYADLVWSIQISIDLLSVGTGVRRETTLRIPQAVEEDAGLYVCSAQLEGVPAMAEAYVTVRRGKSITTR